MFSSSTHRKTILKDVAGAGLGAWEAKPFLEKVIGIVPGIIYIFNQKTQSNEYSNHSIGEALGYSAEEVRDMKADLFPRLCHPDDLPRVLEYFGTLHDRDDGEIAHIEYRMRHKEDRWVWILSYDTIFERDETGAVLRHIGIATDITEQKTAEERARAEKQAADDVTDELRAFAYSVSHDLKSPSNTLELLLHELRDAHGPRMDAESAELLDLGFATVRRMKTLIEDVMRYTSIIGQEAPLGSVPLADVLSDVIEDLRADIRACDGVIDVKGLPVVRGHATHLRMLFQNLLGNALKFRRPGVPPRISVIDTSRAFDTRRPFDRRRSITVADNGMGIPEAAQERIFTMFQRLHTHGEISGTGLGLAICRRIVLSHGGEISVRSTPGSGSAFTVTLETA